MKRFRLWLVALLLDHEHKLVKQEDWYVIREGLSDAVKFAPSDSRGQVIRQAHRITAATWSKPTRVEVEGEVKPVGGEDLWVTNRTLIPEPRDAS